MLLKLWLPHYESFYKSLEPTVVQQLLFTIDRPLKPCRTTYLKRLVGIQTGLFIKKHIEVKTNQWNEDRPGFFEAYHYPQIFIKYSWHARLKACKILAQAKTRRFLRVASLGKEID